METIQLIALLLSSKYKREQLIIPVTNVPKKVCTIDPITGIVPIAVLLISSATIVPAMTLAPVARIFAPALILSPGGKQSGLNKSTLVADTSEAHD